MHTKYFKIAGMSIQVSSDLPLSDTTFHPKFDAFEINRPFDDNLIIHHHFLEDINVVNLSNAEKVYLHPPWSIYKTENNEVVYQWIKPAPPHDVYYRTVVTNQNHNPLHIYNDNEIKKRFLDGGQTSLTLFPSDQILLGRILPSKDGCILHSLGIIHNNNGFLFVGHSDAGKSTMAGLLNHGSEILCDDRNIVKLENGIFKLYGTWSHGDVPDISPESAPLKGIFFLEKSNVDELNPVENKKVIIKKLLACLIRPLTTSDWWDSTFVLIDQLAENVPFWNLKFEKSGNAFHLIKKISDCEI